MSLAGQVVRLPDGRVGTVVYNGLDGVGIKWGRHSVTLDDLEGHGGFASGVSEGYRWTAEAMLRAPYSGATLECVGSEYEVEEAAQDPDTITRALRGEE